MRERRWSARVPMRGDVIINYPPRGSLHGEIRDMSLGGAFIVVPNGGLPLDAVVSLACVLHSGRRRYYRLHGVVVSSREDGCAIVFDRLDADTQRELRETLYADRRVVDEHRLSA